MANEFFISPQGLLFSANGSPAPRLTGNLVTYGALVETFSTDAAAAAYYRVLLAALKTAGNVATDLRPTQVAQITGIVKEGSGASVWNLNTDTVLVYGYGFVPATAGKLWLEDATGGMDSNGFNMQCTYVSPTLMTAVFASDGDSGSPVAMIYYQDTAANQSNALVATMDGSDNVTVSNP